MKIMPSLLKTYINQLGLLKDRETQVLIEQLVLGG